MIVGILSDTHGRHDRARKALGLLRAKGATTIIHCGDIGGEEVLDELATAAAELSSAAPNPQHRGTGVWFVWGNCDHVDEGIRDYVRSIGLTPPLAVPLLLPVAEKSIAVFHGHERELERFDSSKVDYLLHGHSHERRDERFGNLRVINPGALQRAHEHTVATLDISRDELSFWQVVA